MLRQSSTRCIGQISTATASAPSPLAAHGAVRTARTSTRHPAATPRQLPGTDEYREELRRRRRQWIGELAALEEQSKQEEAKRAERRAEKRRQEEEARAAFVSRSNHSISNFEEFGTPMKRSESVGKNPLLADIIAALDAEEGRLGVASDDAAAKEEGEDSKSSAVKERDPVIAQRRSLWNRYIRLRRQLRFNNYLATERANSDNRLAQLLSLFHASENFVTKTNIEEKIDAFLGEKGHPVPNVNYRTESKFPVSKDPIELAMDIKAERRRQALEEAIEGTMTVSVGKTTLSRPNVGELVKRVAANGAIEGSAQKDDELRH